MSRVLFFNSPMSFTRRKDPFEAHYTGIRYGIASIAGYLRAEGGEVQVVEPHLRTRKEIREVISRFDPQIIGIPAYTTEIYDAAATVRLVKEIKPRFTAVIGGALRNSRISLRRLQTLQRRAYRKFYLSTPRRFREFISFIRPRQAIPIIKKLFSS
jgi:predicted GTPase